MASSAAPSPSPRRRCLRRFLSLKRPSTLAVDHNNLMSPSLSSPPQANLAAGKKKAFGSSAFCGLGCAFSDDSSVLSSENSEGKRPKRQRTKKIKETRGNPSSSISSVARDQPVRSRSHGGDRALSEPYSGRRGGNLELRYSVEDSFPSFQATVPGSDPTPSWRYHRLRGYYHHRPAELEQIMNFRHRIRSGRGDAYDRHSDWRLDVDNMTYEDLLELGDKIGYVSTGLREEEISSIIIKKIDMHTSAEKERKCSVCQEEYEIIDEVGKLGCDHSFHIECIKKWLLQKNACPVCKTAEVVFSACRGNTTTTPRRFSDKDDEDLYPGKDDEDLYPGKDDEDLYHDEPEPHRRRIGR